MIGLGSIGKRHLDNLVTVLEKRQIRYQIDALRSRHIKLGQRWERIISREYYDMNELPDGYDIVFVTNPTSMHYGIIKNVMGKTRHMFIEKPLFESTDYCIDELPFKEDSVYYVACPLRHKSIMKYIKKNVVDKRKIISARIISTSYLPSWRKDADYRNTYSSRKDMGGGVTRDLIHEWDYAIYFFGKPDQVMHLQGHLSDLEIDSDDLSIYIARYPGMLLEMHLDYIGHKTERILQMFTDDRRVDVDLIANTVYEYAGNCLVHKQEFPTEDFYLKEMEYFLDCTEKRKGNINTIKDAYNTLEIALTGEISGK